MVAPRTRRPPPWNREPLIRTTLHALAVAGLLVGVLAQPASAADPAGSSGSWTYDDASRARWDPCAPITFRVNEQQQPGAAVDVREALHRVGRATGLVFAFQGLTSFVPTQAQPAPTGTDLVVALVRHQDTDAWQGRTTQGYAGTHRRTAYAADGSSAARITEAYVVVDARARLHAGFTSPDGYGTRGELLMHEAGHVVGLGHVEDAGQLMSPVVHLQDGQWGAGDLAGLAAVGAQQGCLYDSAEQAAVGGGSVPEQPAFTPRTHTTGATPPVVTASPAAVSAGEPATVTYSGTPGARLEVLARTQPAVAFSTVATVVLDASGRATTTHRPQKNTRVMVRAEDGSVSATAPVLAVRSVASLTAALVGDRTYRFTGRVYPARAGRAVTLRRDGVAVARTATDATGAYATTLRLPAGSSQVQVATVDDQDNLGTRSAVLSLLVR